jgi:hypothetical protein
VIAMTFQVCAFGSDGVVLASDLQLSALGGTNSIHEKIVISEDRLLAVATAGLHRLAVDATEELLSLWNDHAPLGEYMLGLLADKIVWRFCGSLPTTPKPGDEAVRARMLILNVRTLELFDVWVGQKSTAKRHTKGCVVGGDAHNVAAFFIARYASNSRPPLPLNKLIPIVAHTTLMASRINPSAVGGLEVVAYENATLRKLSDTEINDLIASSKSLDDEIAQKFGADR